MAIHTGYTYWLSYWLTCWLHTGWHTGCHTGCHTGNQSVFGLHNNVVKSAVPTEHREDHGDERHAQELHAGAHVHGEHAGRHSVAPQVVYLKGKF
jgi:uncharacterized Ntn-hydrolase superfamily protein